MYAYNKMADDQSDRIAVVATHEEWATIAGELATLFPGATVADELIAALASLGVSAEDFA